MTHHPLRPLWAGLLSLTLMPTAFAHGVSRPAGLAASPLWYQIGEQTAPDPGDGITRPADTTADGTAGQGPIRLARFSYVHGDITWRPSADADWSPATVNLPLRQGAQIWVTNGGRAEVQFDDGSLLRLGNGAVVTLQTLYSDADGEYTELGLSEGLASLRLRHSDSIFQVNTPFNSVKAAGPAKVRLGVGEGVEVAVGDGSAAVEGDGRKTVLRAGDYLTLPDAEAAYDVAPLPDPDSWDTWNDDRDRQLTDADSARNLPSDIALVSGDLDDYGAWRDDPQYGEVWVPHVEDAGWRPYQHGHWVWVEPFGWTWVSSEAWGWAPYHYGTWVDEHYGWAWVPGPRHQYWCPAVVHFTEYNGDVAWCPLAPTEVHYPSVVRLSYNRGDWSLHFSIGGCAVYYPENDHDCAPRPFENVYVNRGTHFDNINRGNRDVRLSDYHFVPRNARYAGVTTASATEFGGRGEYRPAPREATAFFAHGRAFDAPARGIPVAGPAAIRPTRESFTPSRTFLPSAHPVPGSLQRPVFRAPLPGRVATVAPPISHPTGRVFRGGTPADQPAGQSGLRRPWDERLPSRPTGQTSAAPLTPTESARNDARAARQGLGRPPSGDTDSFRPRHPQFRGDNPGAPTTFPGDARDNARPFTSNGNTDPRPTFGSRSNDTRPFSGAAPRDPRPSFGDQTNDRRPSFGSRNSAPPSPDQPRRLRDFSPGSMNSRPTFPGSSGGGDRFRPRSDAPRGSSSSASGDRSSSRSDQTPRNPDHAERGDHGRNSDSNSNHSSDHHDDHSGH